MTDETNYYQVQEIHNFGGFFGGDTVTFTATRRGAPDAEETLMIDERAFTNVRDRHTLVPGMLLALRLAGERVDQAELVGAATHAELRAALKPLAPDGPLEGPQVLSYRCDTCGLWVVGPPQDNRCRLCGALL